MADSNILTSLAGHLFSGGALFQNRQYGDLLRLKSFKIFAKKVSSYV